MQTYGITTPEKTVIWLEDRFGKKIDEFTSEESAQARAILDKRKKEKEAEQRKAALERVADDDIPFPLGDR